MFDIGRSMISILSLQVSDCGSPSKMRAFSFGGNANVRLVFFKGDGKIIESKSNWKQKPSHKDESISGMMDLDIML